MHLSSQQTRAVKVILKENQTEEMRMEFLHETEMLKSVSHPNIVRIFEMFEDDINFYLVTELC